MRTIKLTLAYDGTAYAGWQVQPGGPVVQEVLEAAIEKITGQPIRVMASGRTDAGVHALGQVVGFRTESRLAPDVLRRALNAELPRDMAVLEAAEVAEGFHATIDAMRKRYRYVIHDGPVRDVFRRRTSWHCPWRTRCGGHGPRGPGPLRDPRLHELRDPGLRAEDERPHDLRDQRPPGRGGRPPRRLQSRSRPTASSTTWSARSSARWSRWAAAPGPSPGRRGPRRRRPPRRRPHRAAAGVVPGWVEYEEGRG